MSSSERTINFTRGVPADEAFPAPELAECVTAVLRERKVQVLQYGPSTGFLPLREWLAARHGVAVEQVLLGNGSLPGRKFRVHSTLHLQLSIIPERRITNRRLQHQREGKHGRFSDGSCRARCCHRRVERSRAHPGRGGYGDLEERAER